MKESQAQAPDPSKNGAQFGDKDGFALSGEERTNVEEKRPPRPAVLHEIIRREGEQELARSLAALSWSSLAAGLSMGFSMLARGLLHSHLGDYPERFLIDSFGYCFGFLVVILARQQLFTENTITARNPSCTAMASSSAHHLPLIWRGARGRSERATSL